MPIYQFRCQGCGKVFDLFQKMKDERKAFCECGQPAKQVFQATPFKFTFFYGWDHGLGAYCDTKKDKERTMKEKRLIEQ